MTLKNYYKINTKLYMFYTKLILKITIKLIKINTLFKGRGEGLVLRNEFVCTAHYLFLLQI